MNDKEYQHRWYLKNRKRILSEQKAKRRALGGKPRTRWDWLPQDEIVKRLLTTDATIRSIADEYGCSQSTINKIYRCHTTSEQRLSAKYKKQSESMKGYKFNRIRNPRDPQEVKCRTAVNNAVRDGRLIRPKKCQQPGCDRTGRIEAHHWHGYSDEHMLDVVWLCPCCHRFADNQPKVWVLSFELVKG